MSKRKNIQAVLFSAIILGTTLISGCTAKENDTETTTAAISSDTSAETDEVMSESSDTISESTVLETTVSETSTTPETTETSEVTTEEPLTSAETESATFYEDIEPIETTNVNLEHGSYNWKIAEEPWVIEDDSDITITHSESLNADYVLKLNISDGNMQVDGEITNINSSNIPYACDGVAFNCVSADTGMNIKVTVGNTTYNYDDTMTEETRPDDYFPGYDALIYFKELDDVIDVTHVDCIWSDNAGYVWDTDDALIANIAIHFKDGIRDKLTDLIIVKCTDKTICCGIAEFDIGFTVFYQIEVDSSVSDANLLETFSTLISSLEVSTRSNS